MRNNFLNISPTIESYPIIQTNLTRNWASIEIEKTFPALMQLIREVVMIVGESVAIETLAGGIAGSMPFGAGTAPRAIIGSDIGLQVGNLILMALGLAAIGEYFYIGAKGWFRNAIEPIKLASCGLPRLGKIGYPNYEEFQVIRLDPKIFPPHNRTGAPISHPAASQLHIHNI